ncbi:MAG TPA: trypsin-like peptidase domain-containing protein [Micromonosporaceae bacterium]
MSDNDPARFDLNPAGAEPTNPTAPQSSPAPWSTQWHQTPSYSASPLGLPAEPAEPAEPAAPKSSGPGWRGTIGVGAAAAVLAALLTAGGMAAFGSDNSTATVPTASITSSSGTPALSSSSSGVSWEAVSAAVQPSVVAVSVNNGNGSGDEGSGIVLDTTGHILTNNHVIASAAGSGSASNAAAGSGSPITVTLSNGKVYAATVVGADSTTDLAVLKITNPPSGLTPATFGDSSTVKVGEAVMAIGNPLGLSDTVTTGIVSALNRPVSTAVESPQQGQGDPFASPQSQTQSAPVVTNAIQTDAAINPGNSGGALLDTSGHVIGVTSSIASLGSSNSGDGSQSGSIGLGFAIPANEAKNAAQQLIATGTVKHAYLGVSVSDGNATIAGAQQQAAIVGTVSSGTPAVSAGLKDGDAIIALNGQPVESADSLVGQVRAEQPGTKVTLTVVRDGSTHSVALTLGTSPSAS